MESAAVRGASKLFRTGDDTLSGRGLSGQSSSRLLDLGKFISGWKLLALQNNENYVSKYI